MTDLKKLDAANTALQKQTGMAKTTKAFAAESTAAIHSLDSRLTTVEKPPVVVPPVTPPPVVIHEPLPIGSTKPITQGGLYTARWVSTDPNVDAINIQTNEPVVLKGETDAPGVHLNVGVGPRDVTASLKASGATGRFLVAEGFKAIRLLGCDLNKTAGVELQEPVANAVVEVSRHRHRDVQRRGPNEGQFGQIFQFRTVQTAIVKINWLECINKAGEAEDLMSFFKTSNVDVGNFYIDGQPKGLSRSQNAITIDGDNAGPNCVGVHVHDGDILNASGGVFFTQYGVNCLAERVWVLRKGGNDGVDGSAPGGIAPGASNCHQIGCTFGYVDAGGSLCAPNFGGAPGDLAKNTMLTKAQINADARWAVWQAKLAAAGVTIGAGS